MTALGGLLLTVLFHQKGHPALDLKNISNNNSNAIHPFVSPLWFRFLFLFSPGAMGEAVYVEMKGM